MGDPFLEVTLPACEVRRSAVIEVHGHRSNVLHMEQFGGFVHDVMFNEKVMLGFNGSAKAQVRGIKSRVQVNNYVEVAGTFFFFFPLFLPLQPKIRNS